MDKIKRFRKYHPTVENLLKPGKNDFVQLRSFKSVISEYIYDVSLGEDIIYKKKTGESKGIGLASRCPGSEFIGRLKSLGVPRTERPTGIKTKMSAVSFNLGLSRVRILDYVPK